MRAGQQRHRPGEAPAVAMEHGQRPQVARILRHGPGDDVAHGVEVGAPVVRDHALGVARGAAGVAHGDGVPLVGGAVQARQGFVRSDEGLVLARAQALARAGVLAVADVDDHDLAPKPGQGRQRLGHHGRELAVGDQHLGLAVVHLPGQQGRVQAGVERVDDGAQRGDGVVGLHHLGRVGQQGAHRVARADAQGAQRGGQPGGALAHLRPGVAPRAVDDGGHVAEHLGRALDEAQGREGREVGGVAVQVLVVEAHAGIVGSSTHA